MATLVDKLLAKAAAKDLVTATGVITADTPFLRQFEDFDDFIFRADKVDSRKASAVEHHLRKARAALARTLWGQEVFLGIDVIDHLLYDVYAHVSRDPIKQFFEIVAAEGLHRPGFVLYPLHSFGVLGLGFFRFFQDAEFHLTLADAGIALTAQTNSAEASLRFLNEVRKSFGIRKRIPNDTVEHFVRSRPLKWLERNPMLAVKVRSFTGSYYENQFVYILKLRMSTALIMMLSAMGKQYDRDDFLERSSSTRVNNWQTLDIRHYLVFETPPLKRPELLAYCIPMNAARLQLAHLSDLSADLDARAWRSKRAMRNLDGIRAALRTIETGYLTHVVIGTKHKLAQRVYRKLVDSIDYFRRAYSAGAKPSEAIVWLAVAFETLLTDYYAPQVNARIERRVGVCLKGTAGVRKYTRAVAELFEHRGAIVHQGRAAGDLDLLKPRRAYILCLQRIASLLDSLPRESGRPIGDLLGQ
jgi:hypothetical protein